MIAGLINCRARRLLTREPSTSELSMCMSSVFRLFDDRSRNAWSPRPNLQQHGFRIYLVVALLVALGTNRHPDHHVPPRCLGLVPHATRPNASPIRRKQIPTSKVAAVDSVPEMVETIWSDIHHMDWEKSHSYHLGSCRGSGANGEKEHEVFFKTANGCYGRDLMGWGKCVGTAVWEGVEC